MLRVLERAPRRAATRYDDISTFLFGDCNNKFADGERAGREAGDDQDQGAARGGKENLTEHQN